MLALVLALRQGGYRGHVTSGGHFATFAAEFLRDFPELDSICRFEADRTLVELVESIHHGRPLDGVAGLALQGGGEARFTAPRPLPELDGLPWPDRRGEPARCFGHAIMPLVGSRGCYGRCSFCSIAAWQDKGSTGKRFRMRRVEDIADEMAEQQRSRGVEIFVFQDDNFFLPRAEASLARIHALADALAARGVTRFATVVKARADDVQREVFTALVERLHCLRAYVGIESHADAGLRTLARNTAPSDNERALALVRELGLYICFNVLPFDPDATLDTFAENIGFLGRVVDFPFCISRVELYAGTPILARMAKEGRCRGDYLRWDYSLADPRLEQVFRWFLSCLHDRNYGDEAAVVQLWLLRFDVEACRFFHPESYRASFLERAVAITRAVSSDTVRALEDLVTLAREGRASDVVDVLAAITSRARAVDAEAHQAMRALAADMSRAVGSPASLCEVRHVLDASPPAPAFA
ncbi:MAG: radical SAM protein [Byssovorax sp.]